MATRRNVTMDWKGPAVAATIRGAAFAGLVESAEAIFVESQLEIPRASEQAAESGDVIADEAAGTVTITFGDNTLRHGNTSPSNEYIVRLHEDMDQRHPNGGKAKFLEDPLNEAATRAGATVARHVREVLR